MYVASLIQVVLGIQKLTGGGGEDTQEHSMEMARPYFTKVGKKNTSEWNELLASRTNCNLATAISCCIK
jgi:hypothetical protein